MADEYFSKRKQYGNEFLSNHIKAKIFSKISTTSPVIIFPLLSFYFHDWWILLGILFAYAGGLLSIKRIWILIAVSLTIIYSLIFGFALNSYENIYFICYLYGHITFSIGAYFINKYEKTKSDMDSQIEKQVHQMLQARKENKL